MRIVWMLTLTIGAQVSLAQADEFLDPALAFRPSLTASNRQDVATLSIDIAPGYYLYRNRTEFRPLDGARLSEPVLLPEGTPKYDKNFDAVMLLWKQHVQLTLPIPPGQQNGRYELQIQGCAERGLCYPPQTFTLTQGRGANGSLQFSLDAQSADVAPSPSAPQTPGADAEPEDLGVVLLALRSGRWLAVSSLFLLLGLGLAFTPCVLPMMPILSSIIVGQRQTVSRWRGLGLAAAYSLGMALVYTAMGVAAGLAGAGLAAALQNPWVLGAFALLLGSLALSMFGVWEFQMPGFIQSRVQQTASNLPGGRYLGVFAMGGLSALMVGPCVAAPLAGALVYIGQSRDAALGALALFSLAMGMSVPLLLLGMSAGTLLPRAGAWMERVKIAFGVLLLGVALWLVAPVLPGPALPGLLGAMLLLGATQIWGSSPWQRGISLLLGLWAASLLIGAWSGGNSISQPLQHLVRASSSPALASPVGLEFRRVADVAALDAALAQARSESKPVLLDFYADWCVACKEMEHQTFQHVDVRRALQGMVLLQADVTRNSQTDQALLRRFGLFGPPGVLLFNSKGAEQHKLRSIGFVGADEFLRRLHLVALPGA